jgi:hypothetical protein
MSDDLVYKDGHVMSASLARQIEMAERDLDALEREARMDRAIASLREKRNRVWRAEADLMCRAIERRRQDGPLIYKTTLDARFDARRR